jgi:hypothetical protein
MNENITGLGKKKHNISGTHPFWASNYQTNNSSSNSELNLICIDEKQHIHLNDRESPFHDHLQQHSNHQNLTSL